MACPLLFAASWYLWHLLVRHWFSTNIAHFFIWAVTTDAHAKGVAVLTVLYLIPISLQQRQCLCFLFFAYPITHYLLYSLSRPIELKNLTDVIKKSSDTFENNSDKSVPKKTAKEYTITIQCCCSCAKYQYLSHSLCVWGIVSVLIVHYDK